MKHARMITILLMSFAPMHNLTAMEPEEGIYLQPLYNGKHRTIGTETPSNDIAADGALAIDRADQEIKKQIIPRAGFFGTAYPLTEVQHFDLLKIVDMYCKNITQEEIEYLHQKNDLFKQTITYFWELAKKNIDNVTCRSLAAITNPAATQPTSQLNWLSASIKKYIMQVAARDLVHSYDAVFKGHTARVICVDIHAQKDRAVSGGDDGVRLWKITTGEQLHCFSAEGTEPYSVRFNEVCSRFAVAARCKQKEQVKVWDIESKNILYTIPLQSRVRTLTFPEDNEKELAILEASHFSLYQLADYAAVCQKRIKTHMVDDVMSVDCICRKNWTHPERFNRDQTTWTTTNKSHELYLYKRLLLNMIPKSPLEFPDSISDIKRTSLYKNFDSRELKLADELAAQKLAGTLK